MLGSSPSVALGEVAGLVGRHSMDCSHLAAIAVGRRRGAVMVVAAVVVEEEEEEVVVEADRGRERS